MNTKPSDYPLCRHTKTNGRLCQSPALRTSAFCYAHQKLRRTRPSTINPGPGLSTHVLYPLRNAETIRHALSMVLSGLAGGRIETRTAGKMLYALQLASSDLHNQTCTNQTCTNQTCANRHCTKPARRRSSLD